MSFDTRFCLTYIQNQNSFQYYGFDWLIKSDENNNIVLESEYWDKGIPYSFLFKPMNDAATVLQLHDCFKAFRKLEMIEDDLPYRILSTLCMDFKYKLFLYSLVRLPRINLNKELRRLRSREDEIYDELERYIRLYEDSPLFYEQEQQRIEKLKQKRLKKGKQK